MPELNALAEWLGYEVIEDEGEFVVRHRVDARGRWVERETRATAAEVALYDGLRALAALHGGEGGLEGMASVLRVLGLPPEATFSDALKQVVHIHERARLAESHNASLTMAVADLKSAVTQARELPRLTPKGGDRNEFARQVRRVAQQRAVADEGRGVEFGKGVTAMANTVLLLLGEPPLHHTAGEKPERLDVPDGQWAWRQEMADRVKQLKADSHYAEEVGSRKYYKTQGRLDAFDDVVALLIGEEGP